LGREGEREKKEEKHKEEEETNYLGVEVDKKVLD
jgi:hypothetical protein